ncbi:MAG: 23S rRNA (adenine(2503)-C(2))-methyltransferase RlmN, partial [Acidobacteriia bacterium]|nr:23S rRNA (adenine(2503)-C(2))-methyltransferase RlmN [Terriglobia bacterium]
MQSIVGMELGDLEAALGPGEPSFRARQIYQAVYRRKVSDLGEVSNLPKSLRGRLPVGIPGIEKRYESADGTRRYLLRLADQKTVEAVWMPEGERSTICISSQVGCPVNCGFCLTALLGLERNLTAGEIVGQVLRVAADNHLEANADRVNIVMMGQGEPLLNL